jgi:hypothetical protein
MVIVNVTAAPILTMDSLIGTNMTDTNVFIQHNLFPVLKE